MSAVAAAPMHTAAIPAPDAAMLVNGRFATRQPTGVDRFALELLRAAAAHRGTPLPLGLPLRTEPAYALPEGLCVERGGNRGGQGWEQLDLPRLAADLPLVNLCNTAPLLRENQLVVIHDAATVANPQNFSLSFRAWYRVMLTALMKRSRVVASVSRFSADELTRYFGVRRRGVEVIYEGGEHILRKPADTSVIDRLQLHGRRYVLAVGSQSPNKNFAAVAQALDLLGQDDVLLVAVGGGNSRVFAGTATVHERLVPTGYVSDEQLRALYEHASCFVFPSFYEGFGLPPLEAMCCGCPVVVSDRASLPEVCGRAALYCDPGDPATLAARLKRVLGSAAARADLAAAGRERTAMFTWERAARQFNEIMEANFP
jgi:glycosyltransferase involved in cell wall biosynthesis